ANGRMIVLVSEPELSYTGNFSWINDGAEGWDLSGDTGRLSTVRFRFIKSGDSAYHVFLRKSSHGRTHEEAQARAEKIQYHITSKDSVLDLGNGYTVDKESKFRGQEVEVEIQIPAGKRIHFDQTILEKLNPPNFTWNRTRRTRTFVNGRETRDWYYNENYFRFRTDVDYTMGIDGKLKDPTGNSVNADESYRYYDDNNRKDTIHETLEERKRRWKEEGEKIKQDEKKQKRDSGKQESIGEKDAVASSHRSIVFSLAETFF